MCDVYFLTAGSKVTKELLVHGHCSDVNFEIKVEITESQVNALKFALTTIRPRKINVLVLIRKKIEKCREHTILTTASENLSYHQKNSCISCVSQD